MIIIFYGIESLFNIKKVLKFVKNNHIHQNHKIYNQINLN
jgi:hypothetical protein